MPNELAGPVSPQPQLDVCCQYMSVERGEDDLLVLLYTVLWLALISLIAEVAAEALLVVEVETAGSASVKGYFISRLVADALDDVDLAVGVLVKVEGPALCVMVC